MARRQSVKPDPALAHSHDAGASVVCIQVFEHERLGAVSYVWPRFWPDALTAARTARDELGRLHDQIAGTEPGPDGVRSISYEVVQPAVAAHMQMAIAAVLTLRYFTLELERSFVELDGPSGQDDLGRFRAACGKVGITDPAKDERWALVGELAAVRDRVEHPTQASLYSVDSWDRVPLAWCLTKRALICFDAFDGLFCDAASSWESKLKLISTELTTVDVLQRGLRSRRSPARAPRRPSE